MPSPFPGMDPYLEHPALWPTVHHWMISVLAEALGSVVPEHYWIAIEERAYRVNPEDLMLVGRPDASLVTASPPSSGHPGEVMYSAASGNSQAGASVRIFTRAPRSSSSRATSAQRTA